MFSSKIYESWRSLQYEKYEYLIGRFPQFFDGTILDLACGSGFLKAFLEEKKPGIRIVGTDVEGGDVIANAEALPFPDSMFEKMICIDALHLFKPDLRVLKKGGLILASIFFNDDNFEERKSLLYSRLEGLFITNELVFKGQEKELFVLTRK